MSNSVVFGPSVNFTRFHVRSNEAVRKKILHLTKFSVSLDFAMPVGSGLGRRLGALPCITLLGAGRVWA